MKHNFTGKSIKCDTWEQMEHLAKLAEEQGYRDLFFKQSDFEDGECYFVANMHDKYYFSSDLTFDEIVITYHDFINPPFPTEVVEVTGCGDCPFYSMVSSGDFCGYPKQEIECDDIFSICPLKKASITIKLKQNDTTGN
jgi:hypothetical protein